MTAWHTAKLADGSSSGETDSTGVLPRSPASIDPLSLDPSGPKHVGHGARWCVAAFRHVRTGVVGNVFTEATTRDGEDETRARDGGTVRWCAGHGECQLRRSSAMASGGGTGRRPSPKDDWLS